MYSRRRPPAWPQSFQSLTGTALAASLNANLMPMDVYSLDCPFFHPDDVIQDHGGTLHRDSSDNYGIPKLSHWAFIACRHGEHTRRKGSIASKRNVMKWIAFGLKDFRQIEIERPKLEKMSVILADQLIDNAVIESTVNKKRSLIKVKDSGVLDNLVRRYEASSKGITSRYQIATSSTLP